MTLHRITPKYVYPIMLIVIGGVYCYFLLKGQPHLLFFALILLLLFGILISKFSKLNQIYGLMIFLAPVSFSIDLPGGLSLKTPLEILLILIGFSYFFKTAFGWKSSQIEWKHILILLIGLDLLWTLVTTANSEHILISSKRFILKALFVFGFFFLFQLLTNQDRGKLYKLFGWGLLIPISIISINHGYYGFVQGASFDVSKPFFDDHTQYGACLAFVLPYFILHLKTQSKFNYLNFAITLVIICAVVLSYSRAAWISLIGALFMYFLLKIGVRFIPLLIILCSIILFVSYNFADYYDSLRNNEVKYGDDVTQHLSSVTNLQNDASNLERINRWVCAYRMFEAKPYVGYGPGTYQFVYDQFQTPEYMTRISTHGGDRECSFRIF